jgi:hypothetical protein
LCRANHCVSTSPAAILRASWISKARSLAAIHQVVQSTGNDVPLDGLLIRLHMETACRRGGALALRLHDLDTQSCAVRLQEKG